MVDQPAGRRDGLLDLDELDLVCIDPLPPMCGTRTWPTSPNGSATGAGRRLARAIDGRGVFRRFKAEPISVWYGDFRLRATIPSTEG